MPKSKANIIIQIINSNKPRLDNISADLARYMENAGYIRHSQSVDYVPVLSRYQATHTFRSKLFHADPLASRASS